MASLLSRNGRLYAKIKDIKGEWRRLRTNFVDGQDEQAQAWADAREREVQEARALLPPGADARFAYCPRYANDPSTREGWIYAVALDPSVHPFRVKVGFTARHVAHRLATYRTSNPLAVALGVWDADLQTESRVHAELPRRIGTSEVFVADDVESLLAAVDRIIERRA